MEKPYLTLEQIRGKYKDKPLWFYLIKYSKRTYIRPTEVYLRDSKTGIVSFVRKKDDTVIIGRLYEYDEFEGFYILSKNLFETREECVEAYNSEILNQKDKLQHNTERIVKYLNSMLI